MLVVTTWAVGRSSVLGTFQWAVRSKKLRISWNPPRIPWCEFLSVALHLSISLCLVGLTEICRSAKSGGDKSVEKKKIRFRYQQKFHFIFYRRFQVGASGYCRPIRNHSQVFIYVFNWQHWRWFSQLKGTSAHSQRRSSTIEIKKPLVVYAGECAAPSDLLERLFYCPSG